MDAKNMTMAIVALTIGVVLIAGGVTPILVSAISGSGSDEVTFTNTGGKIGEISDIIEKYDIHTVYETVDEDTDPWEAESTGTRTLQIMPEDDDLVWSVAEFTEPWIDENPVTRTVQSQTITTSCVLLCNSKIVIVYDYENKMLKFAINSDNHPTFNQAAVSDFHSISFMYRDYGPDEGMILEYHFSSEEGWYNDTNPDGYFYDPSGDKVSMFGDDGKVYYKNELIYGYLNTESTEEYSITTCYLNDNGEIVHMKDMYDDYTLDNIVDNHLEIFGCNYMDLDGGQGISMTLTPNYDTPAYTVNCNIFIVPITVKGTAQEVRNEGQTMTKIEDLMAQGYSYKVEPVSEGSTYYKWEILDSSDNVIRSEEFTEFITTPFIISDKIFGAYRDLNTSPKLHDFYLATVDNIYNVAPNPTDFVLTISMENGITTLRATSDKLDSPLEITGMTGFLTDSEGDWTYIHTEPRGTDSYPVKYSNINNVYFMNSAGIYGYQGGMSSNLVIFGGDAAGVTPTTTVTVDRLEGVSDFGMYKQFDCVAYNSANGDPEIQPSGILLKIEDPAMDMDMTLSADMYIVPTVAYEPSEDSDGLDPALVAVISIIPVVMIAGLIVTAITMWKAQ